MHCRYSAGMFTLGHHWQLSGGTSLTAYTAERWYFHRCIRVNRQAISADCNFDKGLEQVKVRNEALSPVEGIFTVGGAAKGRCAYKLRPDVLMTARFAADGQVCEMTIEKRETTDTGIRFGDSFSEKEVQGLIDDLVPQNERGDEI
jgi:hypothetical protein